MIYLNRFRSTGRILIYALTFSVIVNAYCHAQRLDSANIRLCETCSQISMAGFRYADSLSDGSGNTIFLASAIGLPYLNLRIVGQRSNVRIESNYLYGCVVPTLVLPYYKGAYFDTVCKETKVAFRATSLRADSIVQQPLIDKLFWETSKTDSVVDDSDTGDVLRVKFANSTGGQRNSLVVVSGKRGLYRTRKADSINITINNTTSPELKLQKLLSYDICPGTDPDFSSLPLFIENRSAFQKIEWDTLPSPYFIPKGDTIRVRPPVNTTYLVTGSSPPCRTTEAIVVRVVQPSANVMAPDITFVATEQEGKLQNIPIKIRANGSFLHSCTPNSVRFEVSFNKTMFLPEWIDGVQTYEDNDTIRTVTITAPMKPGSSIASDRDSILYAISGFVLLGNADSSALTVRNVRWCGENYYGKKSIGCTNSSDYREITQDSTDGILRVTPCNITTPRYLTTDGSVRIVGIAPNPVSEKASVLIESTIGQSARLVLFNSLGQELESHDINLQKGGNRHLLETLSGLESGAYTIRLTSGTDQSDSMMFITR